jgi:imidazolonepropionase-like amidohydrolase
MAKAGVPILAGAASGFALQDELELLVKAGLTPLEALRSATYEPARLMHRQSTFGQIRKGYAADLVVLGGNPLANIGNTRRIETVFLRGRIVKPGPSVRGALSGAAAASGSLPSAAF